MEIITAEAIQVQLNHHAKKQGVQLHCIAAFARLGGGVRCSAFLGSHKTSVDVLQLPISCDLPLHKKTENKN